MKTLRKMKLETTKKKKVKGVMVQARSAVFWMSVIMSGSGLPVVIWKSSFIAWKTVEKLFVSPIHASCDNSQPDVKRWSAIGRSPVIGRVTAVAGPHLAGTLD